MLAVVLADLVNRDDVGVLEIGGGLGLGAEPRDVSDVGQRPGENHLQRDVPV